MKVNKNNFKFSYILCNKNDKKENVIFYINQCSDTKKIISEITLKDIENYYKNV